MISALCMITIATMAWCALRALRVHTPFSINFGALVAMLFFFGGPLFWLSVFGAIPLSHDFAYTAMSDVTKDDQEFLIYICVALMVTALALAAPRLGRYANIEQPEITLPSQRASLLAATTLFYFGSTLAIYLYAAQSPDAHWYHSREAFVESLGSVGVCVSYLATGARLVLIGILAGGVTSRGLSARSCAAMAVFACYDLYVTGNRIGVLLLMFSTLCVLLQKRQYRPILFLCLCAPLLGMALSAYAYIRPYVRSGESLAAVMEFGGSNLEASIEGSGSLVLGSMESVNMSTLKSLYEDPDAIDVQLGATYLRPVLMFIPRSLWSEKPESPTVQAGKAYAAGRTSLVVTYIGEGMMNFRLLGFLIGLPVILIALSSVSFGLKGWIGLGPMKAMLGFLAIRMAFSDVVIWSLFAVGIYQASRALVILLRNPAVNMRAMK